MRLLTRSDFDGLVCAVFLCEQNLVDDYKFVHPKDVQDGKVEVNSNDILANIPYIPGCGLWFDHHASEKERLETEKLGFEGDSRPAPSAAQVIWDYYGGTEGFSDRFLPLLEAVNKSDSGNLEITDITDPQGYILLSFIMDPRTGLGRVKEFGISNYKLMEDMIQYCRTKTVEEILEIPDVRERVDTYTEQTILYIQMLHRTCEIKDNVIVTNLLDEDPIYCSNRFLVYTMFPDQNIEVRVMPGRDNQNVVFTCGHSITNKTSKTNVGNLMLKYGGGGHEKVGTCQVAYEDWERVLGEIVQKLREDG